MSAVILRPVILIALCALAYAAATYAMKTASHGMSLWAATGIAMALSIAVMAEVLLMRDYQIGLVYVAILVAETLLIIGIAFAIGEGLTLRQIAGAALVVFGALMVTG